VSSSLGCRSRSWEVDVIFFRLKRVDHFFSQGEPQPKAETAFPIWDGCAPSAILHSFSLNPLVDEGHIPGPKSWRGGEHNSLFGYLMLPHLQDSVKISMYDQEVFLRNLDHPGR
jgi:hypothetical protein